VRSALVLDQDRSSRNCSEALETSQLAALRPVLATIRQVEIELLDHPTISDQLRDWLSDSQVPEVRAAAVDIARCCSRSDLSEELATLAVGRLQPMELRERAAAAVAEIGTRAARSMLKPLARGEAGDDPRDQLRGYGLQAVWPGLISAEELFDCMGRTRDDHFYGSYQFFLHHSDFTAALQPGDLPLALRWIDRQQISRYPTDDLRDCAYQIVLRAWEQSDRDDVRQALAAVFWNRLRRHDHDLAFGDREETQTLRDSIQRQRARRRAMVAQIVVNAEATDQVTDLLWCDAPLVYAEDFEWVVERALGSASPETERWVELAKYTFNPNVLSDVESAHSAMRDCALLRDAMGSWFNPVELGSPEALEMKTRHEEREKWKRPREPKLLDPPPQQRVKQVVHRCLAGHPELWWHLAREMTLEAASEKYNYDLFLNPVDSPVWREGNSAMRAEVLEAARRFVQAVMPDETWIGTNRIPVSELGGFAAFRLLLEEDPTFLETVNDSVWRRWAPSVFAYLVADNRAESARAHHRLIAVAYRHAPIEILVTLDRLISEENDRYGHVSVLDRLEDSWDSDVSEAVLRRAAKLDLKPVCFGNLLKPLLERHVDGATALAVSLVTNPPPPTEPERAFSIEAAVQLLARNPSAGWGAFWEAVGNDPTWGKKVLEDLCRGHEGGKLVQQLDESQVGQLLEWLLIHYPHKSDPKGSGGFAGGDDMVRLWRDGLIYRLRNWGTAAAVAEIERLKAAHPELRWLEWTSLLAARMRQKRAWQPATPRQIIEMPRDRNRRFVASGGQLLDALQESFERYQLKLQGETPRARLLWDTVVQRPKKEEDFADDLKTHLEGDLVPRRIIVGREVKIRRRNWSAGVPGQLTDIHVDAVSTEPGHSSADRVRAILEVKGCWHPEVRTAMETQLLQRYLTQNQCQHGLYVVGWFQCDYWDDEDYRKADAAKTFGSIDECREFLDTQAKSLSALLAPAGGEIRAVVLDYRLQ
jgi:hypothetical protein